MHAAISRDPLAGLLGQGEPCSVIDTTPCTGALLSLAEMARHVNEHPERYCQAAHVMAWHVAEIERMVADQLSEQARELREARARAGQR